MAVRRLATVLGCRDDGERCVRHAQALVRYPSHTIRPGPWLGQRAARQLDNAPQTMIDIAFDRLECHGYPCRSAHIHSGLQRIGAMMSRVRAQHGWVSRIAAPLRSIILAAAILVFVPVAHAALHIGPASAPQFVDVNLGPLVPMMDAGNPQRQARIDAVSQHIAAAIVQHQGELIVLRPLDFSLAYDQLSTAQKNAVAAVLGALPAAAYENAVASSLESIIGQVRSVVTDARLSVFGLPTESTDEPEMNQRYANVIAACSAIVSSRAIIASGSGEGEVVALRRSLLQAVRFAKGRELYYRCNGEWRVAVTVDGAGVHDVAINDTTAGASNRVPSISSETPAAIEALSAAGRAVKPGQPAANAAASKYHPSAGADSQHVAALRAADAGPAPSSATTGANKGDETDGGAQTTAPAGGTTLGGITPGGTTAGGTGAPGPSGPPEGSTPPTNGPLRLFVTQKTNHTVHSIYPQVGAKDSITIYGSDIDPDDDGLFSDPQPLINALNQYVPVDYKGPVCLDWEGYGGHLLASPIGTPGRDVEIGEFVRAIQVAHQTRPNAKFGFYTLPFSSLYDRDQIWHDHNASLMPIYDASQCLFPSIYRFYPDNQPFFGAAEDKAYVKESVALALEFAKGKPVYPYMWPRFHNSNQVLGYHLIPEAEFKAHVSYAFKAQYNGDRADGVVWWGADQHFYWVAQNFPEGGPGEYSQGPILLQVFNQEFALGETPAQHWTRLHKRTLRQLYDVLRTAQEQIQSAGN
jgi:Hyaluronidase